MAGRNKTCQVDGCDRPASARGRCSPHYHAWRRSDDPDAIRCCSGKPRTETPSIRGMHRRIVARRGPAKAQACVDCGRRALDWSLRPSTPPAKLLPDARIGQLYSLDPADYEPRCRSCHVRLDRAVMERIREAVA